jgi:hypothetical protein
VSLEIEYALIFTKLYAYTLKTKKNMKPSDLGYIWISDRDSLIDALRIVAEAMADIAVGSLKDRDDVDAPVEFIKHPECAGDYSALMDLACQIAKNNALSQDHIRVLARVLETTDFGNETSRNTLSEMLKRITNHAVSKELQKAAAAHLDGPTGP